MEVIHLCFFRIEYLTSVIIASMGETNMEKIVAVSLKTHEEYLGILNKLKSKSKYVEIVQIDGFDKEDKIVEFANCHLKLIEKREVNKWLGTKTNRVVPKYVYLIPSEGRDFWKFLSRFSSFYLESYSEKYGYMPLETEFGLDDIAFLDKDKNPLFYTTTHEGYADIAVSLIDK